ncbi:rhomboid family intramembrane serine protease [Chitinophaga nivalis]|uniref:Rhomboid family intramembrane serine protease n=1 Tax=Chitinophaga nivalis TaxID=2991709 RepID=A0ABT3IUS4_9BACT|nr:rhomboid family intramembrane serine protease [Chitinophaga nivalis]MCW3462586.1 rhomboid family intramembrane serine protease [Chitinophaga nivalis]MCW3487723.1 rhomboid family intramembrane serine protease [Chitinophaga nivalis]
MHREEVASGKHREDLNFSFYITIPLRRYNSGSVPLVWLGQKYQHRINNRLSIAETEAEYTSFLQSVDDKWRRYNSHQETYFECLHWSDESEQFKKAITSRFPDAGKHAVILIPRYTAFESRGMNSLPWIIGTIGIGVLLYFMVVLFCRIDDVELRRFKKGLPLQDDMFQWVFQFLHPRGKYPMTAILIHLNLLYFVFMVLGGLNPFGVSASSLLPFGGLYYPLVTTGEYWRIPVSIFVNASLMHLGYNMIGLVSGGLLLERFIGARRLLAVYLITGIIAAICSMLWRKDVVHLGPPGATFGLYGVLAGLLIRKAIPAESRVLIWWALALYVGLNLTIRWVTPNATNAEHLSGLIAGFICGVLPVLPIRNTGKHIFE